MRSETGTEFEPHLYLTVGSHIYVWHRFTEPTRSKNGDVILHTKCGRDVNDHWNVRTVYNPRLDDFCAKCFPNGVNKDGSPKSSTNERTTQPDSDPANATGNGSAVDSEQRRPEGSEPLTSTPVAPLSEVADAGDGGAAPKEGRGVQRAGHEGHVEELPSGGEAGDPGVAGSPSKEAGQGKSNRESGKGQSKQSTGSGGKSPKGTS